MRMKKEKLTVPDIVAMKKKKIPITFLTAYDYPQALLADQAETDMILVGDSGGMVSLGYENTLPVTMDEMIHLCKPVARAVKRALVIGDMPFMSYQVSIRQAIRNAGRFVKEGMVDTVKLEGGAEFAKTVRAIIKAGIPVMGHIGMTPQSAVLSEGYKVQGKTAMSAKKIIYDAKAIEEAGAYAILIENVTSEVSKIIAKNLTIPLIGIGGGPHCDGQALVLHDVIGLFQKFTPKFAKQYVNLFPIILKALKTFNDETRKGEFPDEAHTFHMDKEEIRKLQKLLKSKL